MRYQNPQLLFALFVIVIPIILHLFNLRKYKTIRFSSIHLLKEIKKTKRSRSQLKNILILLSRILAITFLVLAFAKPYIPTQKDKTGIIKNIFFYIDNSFSMEAVSENGMLLDVAKSKAEKIANQYNPESNFFIITNDFSSTHSIPFSKAEIGNKFQQLVSSAQYKSLEEIISRQQSLLKQNTEAQMYVLTDMQKSTFDIQNINQIDNKLSVLILPLNTNNTSNLYIDSCWTESPIIQEGKPIEIIAKVVNKSAIDLESLPAFLYVNNQQKAISNFNILANEIQEITFNFTPLTSGFKQCKITLQDHPISFDDNFFFSFEILERIKVLNIYEREPNFSLESLFKDDDAINYKSISVGQINYEEIKTKQLLLLDGLTNISSGLQQTIGDFVKEGGSIAIFPNQNIDFEDYKSLCILLNIDEYLVKDTIKQEVTRLFYQHKLFNGVFEQEQEKINLPKVSAHYKISNKSTTTRKNILTLEKGDGFINHYTYFSGDIYLFSSPLHNTSSNLEKHALFVPLLYNMALMSYHASQFYYTIKENQHFDAPKSNNMQNIYHLKSEKYDIIPSEKFVGGKRKLYVDDQIKEAGNYLLTANNETLNTISFNYRSKESEPNIYSREEVKEILQKNNITNIQIGNSTNKNLSNIVQKINLGKSYWKTCIVLALLFLLIEILLIKFLKS